jgi:hypothetical protein
MQGLHQVAKKSIIMGFPLFEKEDVFTLAPSVVKILTEGTLGNACSCAELHEKLKVKIEK